MQKRRTAVMIVQAKTGYVNAARKIIGKAIREGLNIKKWYQEPYMVHYMGDKEMRSYDSPDGRYFLEVTDEELEKVLEILNKLAERDGWTKGAPVDVYHDDY